LAGTDAKKAAIRHGIDCHAQCSMIVVAERNKTEGLQSPFVRCTNRD